METNNVEDRFLTKEEEERLAEGLRKALISENPNPGREGCPDPRTIRDLAFHKRIGDPEYFERVTNHMAECSACVRDALGYAEEYKEIRNRRRAVSLTLAAAAVLMISLALWAIWRAQQQKPTIVKSRPVPAQSSPAPQIAGSGNQNKKPEIAKFTPLAIELPLSWRGAAASDRMINLPRAHLQLEIRLPIGSAEGTYKLRITDSEGKEQLSAEGTTHTANGITFLSTILDTSSMSPGNYTLAIMEPGLDEWSEYPLTIESLGKSS